MVCIQSIMFKINWKIKQEQSKLIRSVRIFFLQFGYVTGLFEMYVDSYVSLCIWFKGFYQGMFISLILHFEYVKYKTGLKI